MNRQLLSSILVTAFLLIIATVMMVAWAAQSYNQAAIIEAKAEARITRAAATALTVDTVQSVLWPVVVVGLGILREVRNNRNTQGQA